MGVSENARLVSIIVPIYNVEKYLCQCVDSLINQSYTCLEIILVNDGSTDNCPCICEEYARKDSRIRVVHKENGGLSSARNAGIQIAEGEYISFVDSDDYVLIDMIEQLITTLNEANAQISICSMSQIDTKLERGINLNYTLYTPKDAMKEIFQERCFNTSAWGKMYKRTLFERIRFPDGLIYEDYATIYKLFAAADRIAFSDIKKYFYRTNSESITQVAFNEKHMDYFIVGDKVFNTVKKEYPDLCDMVRNRNTNYAISFYRKMCISDYSNLHNEGQILSIIKKGILAYCSSKYPLSKKIGGCLIACFPKTIKKMWHIKKFAFIKNRCHG